MGNTLALFSGSSRSASQRGVLGRVLGTLLGLSMAFGLGQTGAYGLSVLLTVGLLIALGRSGLFALEWQLQPASGEPEQRLPILEQALGSLLGMFWISPPGLLSLCLGFFLYRLLDVYPSPLVRRLRQAGTRDRLLLAQCVLGLMVCCCLALLRLWVLPSLGATPA